MREVPQTSKDSIFARPSHGKTSASIWNLSVLLQLVNNLEGGSIHQSLVKSGNG